MARLAVFAALAIALLAVPARAQEAPGALAWLTGAWRGEGTMFGAASRATLELRPALGGRFVELSYRAGAFEGRAFYRPVADRRWRATWFDNRGVTFPIEATVAARMLTAEWGAAGSETGRTVYRLLDDGRLEVVDTVTARDGRAREFARHVFSRAP